VLGGVIASGRGARDARGVSSDRTPPTFTEAESPAITPLEFVVMPGDGGLSTTTLERAGARQAFLAQRRS
jgi:hypothetical protein